VSIRDRDFLVLHRRCPSSNRTHVLQTIIPTRVTLQIDPSSLSGTLLTGRCVTASKLCPHSFNTVVDSRHSIRLLYTSCTFLGNTLATSNHD